MGYLDGFAVTLRQHRLFGTVNDTVQGHQRRLIARIQLERLSVRLHRANHVLQVRLEQLTDAVLQNHRLCRRTRQLDFPLERREQVVPALGATIQPIEGF